MEEKKIAITNDLLASKWQRLLNLVIDLMIIYCIWISFETIIVIISDVLGNYSVSEWIKNVNNFDKSLFAVALLFIYYSLTEIYFSRTFAKYFTKTVVIMNDGSKPNINTIIRRTFCRLIPFEAFSFLGTGFRGWHDSFSNTYVVKKHKFKEKKYLFSDFI